jgi:dTDP-glucose 4,6-dehydratase
MSTVQNNYCPRNILITGGAGFIGSNFIRYLLAHYSEMNIINLDLLTYAGSLKNLENLPAKSNYTFIRGDINDAMLVAQILQQYQIDTVVHFAAESHVDRSIQGPAEFIQTNIMGTFTLLEAVRNYWLHEKKWNADQCRFHHISTDEVFGSLNKNDSPFTESTAYAPNSPYSASKAASDHLVRSYFHTYQLPMTISNCSNNYGPNQHAEKLIPTIIRHCFEKKPIPIYGDGSNIRDWLYVEDHCKAVLSILLNGAVGDTYNIGGNQELDNLTLAKEICAAMNKAFSMNQAYSSLITFVKDRPGHDWRYAIDSSKMSRQLGWQPQETLLSGINKTIRFYHALFQATELCGV